MFKLEIKKGLFTKIGNRPLSNDLSMITVIQNSNISKHFDKIKEGLGGQVRRLYNEFVVRSPINFLRQAKRCPECSH